MSLSPPPPSRANLKAWWNQFKFMQRMKNPGQRELPPGYGYGHAKDGAPHPVFGAPLHESLRYASVQVSTANSNGELYVWGDIPVVVAKCGLFLKENATEVKGTFRVSGSNKRMRDLQALFEAPPRYGKNLDWKKENYTSHDVASVFRRYLTQMPEPVIPYDLYSEFREALSKNQSTDEIIKAYKQLIRSMRRQNQYLLLYVLDLLSVFARKADKNLMTATNLAVIFRPGLISHPLHELSPKEHLLSQKVLEFLIEHQDWFMLDVPPPPPPPKSTSIEDKPYGERAGSPHPTIVSSPTEPGWRLIEKSSERTRAKAGRRRSSSASGIELSGALALGTAPNPSPNAGSHIRIASSGRTGESSPSPSSNVGPGLGGVTVSRSRTLPTRRTSSRDAEGGQKEATVATREGRNVLKKQKRTSLQTQRSAPLVPQVALAAQGQGNGPS